MEKDKIREEKRNWGGKGGHYFREVKKGLTVKGTFDQRPELRRRATLVAFWRSSLGNTKALEPGAWLSG